MRTQPSSHRIRASAAVVSTPRPRSSSLALSSLSSPAYEATVRGTTGLLDARTFFSRLKAWGRNTKGGA